MTNGTLDTRLDQNLVKEFNIPANKEYDKFNPFKIGGGNAIWITHIPPNVKVWFSTNQNFDNAQRLDYMNRGMRYLEIGNEGMTRIYDNFYIFTEGVVDDDFIKICVSTQGANVEPILSSNTNQIYQVDLVGCIDDIGKNFQRKIAESIQSFYAAPKLLYTYLMSGEYQRLVETVNDIRGQRIAIPFDKTIKEIGFKNDKFYKIEIFGHFDIGIKEDSSEGSAPKYFFGNTHFSFFNNTNGATFTPFTSKDYDIEFDNIFIVNKRPWADEIHDIFDIYGYSYIFNQAMLNTNNVTNVETTKAGYNNVNNLILKGEMINKYEQFSVFVTIAFLRFTADNCHSSLLFNIYELN